MKGQAARDKQLELLKSMEKGSSSSSSGDDAQIEYILGRAAEKAEALAVDEAAELYRQALGKQPRCLAALNGLADCLMSLGDRDAAMDALRRSIELSPEGNAERYMNLGQICEGADALQWLEAGVRILRAERNAAGSASGERADLHTGWREATHALASALCSVAEVYLTDACDEPDAEEKCTSAAEEAVALVRPLGEQTLAEPYVTCASLRVSQQRGDEAKALLMEALAVINSADEETPPPFDLRLSASKLLMEAEEPALALELLQVLRLEHDDHLETW